MKYSRPGYQTVEGDEPLCARLNDDMIPAINRKAADEAKPKEGQKVPNLDKRVYKGPKFPPDAAPVDIDYSIAPAVPPDVLRAAQRTAPEIIANPTPSPPLKVLEPGK